ncbi:MAG TPA: SDR family NAD(P)-dependent oxidoreductase [Ktedonobacterales bacterium]|jgi:3-oxoacyl-[acyl-carrier protein] reductase
MELGLRGKVALVTGASRGIGRSIANAFAQEGCHLVLAARSKDALERAAEELRAHQIQVLTVPADLTITDDCKRLVEQTIQRFGRVDVLVLNAGGAPGAGFLETSEDQWMIAVNLNLMAAVRLCRLVIPHMREHGGGSIITISSIYGRESGGRSAYNAVKAAVISLTKALAREFARDHIRVNSIAPGSILFPGSSWDRRQRADPAAMAVFVNDELPLGRFGKPEEIASTVVFLASDQASLITGACLNVDGGQSRSNI